MVKKELRLNFHVRFEEDKLLNKIKADLKSQGIDVYKEEILYNLINNSRILNVECPQRCILNYNLSDYICVRK